MNYTLKVYTELTELLINLCQLTNREEFVGHTKKLEELVIIVNKYKLFPLDIEVNYISKYAAPDKDWDSNRLKLCRSLYIALATLMYRFEGSNIDNRAYFDYNLELARTSLPYEITNEWGKEYILDNHFSHEGFFFAINRDKRFLLNSKEDYNNYSRLLREQSAPQRPTEKEIPASLLKELRKSYNDSYMSYCDTIDKLYPEIKYLFRGYNRRIRIYLCSYNVNDENSKIDFILVNYYPSTNPEVSVYPYYVDCAYRFCNIEEIDDELLQSSLSAFKINDKVRSFISSSSVYHEANCLFVQNASLDKIKEYVCYFLRGQQKTVKVKGDGTIQCENNTLIFCSNDVTLNEVSSTYESCNTSRFMFISYPSQRIYDYLKENNIEWTCIHGFGQDMINNDNAKMLHWFIHDNISALNNIYVDYGGSIILEKLKKCLYGKIEWHDYELLGTDAFEYLFSDDFHEYIYQIQSSTDDNIQRRDLIVNNNYKDQSSFWGRMHANHQCNVIIVDFKNYSDPIDSNCIFSVTKYMSCSLGNLAIIFSRNGVSESGHKEQVRLCRDGKVVLCISDDNLSEMIHLKQSNQDPTSILEKMYFSLIQSV